MRLLLFSAFICARALALPAARGNALRPGDLERTTGPKCCHCGQGKEGCWQDAGLGQDAENPLKKESCTDTCAEYGGNHGVLGYTKKHYTCATLAGHGNNVNSAVFHPTLAYVLASASGDNTAKLWNIPALTAAAVLKVCLCFASPPSRVGHLAPSVSRLFWSRVWQN